MRSQNPLAKHYSAFEVGDPDRLLLTGHSHQAWPDVARDGLVEAFDDAASRVDEKWERALGKAERLRAALREWIDDPRAEIALGASTHELLVRLLSALPLRPGTRLVTTDREFHTMRRQLARLQEAGLDIVRVSSEPLATLAERLGAAVDDRTAAVLVSAVLFESSGVVHGLGDVAARCEHHGAELVIDVYHALGPVSWSLREERLESAWVLGGGYKYLQLGEGNCFMRLPSHADRLRPVVTGWYAEFAELADAHSPAGRVAYPSGAARFAGATYDPTSHYRAVSVIDFFAEQGLTRERLSAEYARQVGLLVDGFDALDVPPQLVDRDRSLGARDRAGFLALRTPRAAELWRALLARGVMTDFRGGMLRLGPAPYLSDAQMHSAIERLGDAIREQEGTA